MSMSSNIDILILSIFAILITLRPNFIQGHINIFELGLYLSGIETILDGGVPYRDVFHLRGPFELYMPTMMMEWFGMHIKVLYSYFYIGNVLCIILAIMIAKELFKTRLVLYLMVPVFIGRTFPRVVFTYWGGMRYAFGLLTLYFILRFFKSNRGSWLWWAGISTACALLTSIEMGIYPMMGFACSILLAFIIKVLDWKALLKACGLYAIGVLVVVLPTFWYLAAVDALIPYLDAVWTVVTRMQIVIDPHYVSEYPSNLPEAVWAMINPNHTNFKHMTPSYLYLAVLGYLIYRFQKSQINRRDLFVLCLGIYGFVMYNTGFRGIWAAQFEMALQPEKILLFFLGEIILLFLLAKSEAVKGDKLTAHSTLDNRAKFTRFAAYFFCFCFIGSSIGYPIQRYNHRFYAFKYVVYKAMGKDTKLLEPLADEPTNVLTVERVAGIRASEEQVRELEEVNEFVKNNIGTSDKLFVYPDAGGYNYIFDRQFFHRFPQITMSWFNDEWFASLLDEFKSNPPEFAIIQSDLTDDWKAVHLGPEPNRIKHNAILNEIESKYTLVRKTPRSDIYRLNVK